MVASISFNSSSVSALTLAFLNSVSMVSFGAMLMLLVISCAEITDLTDPIPSPVVEEEWLGTSGFSPPSLGLEIANLGCSTVCKEKSDPGSEVVLLCLW